MWEELAAAFERLADGAKQMGIEFRELGREYRRMLRSLAASDNADGRWARKQLAAIRYHRRYARNS